MFNASFLTEVRKKAIRGKVWFKALDSLERGILSLSSRVLDVVHSASLGSVLAEIVCKIEDALKSVFVRQLEGFGLARATVLVGYAVKLGHRNAKRWLDDIGYARYITFLSLNMPIGWSI
jgi:hypothetical protein